MKNNNTTIKKYISKSMISVFTCSVLASAALATPLTSGTIPVLTSTNTTPGTTNIASSGTATYNTSGTTSTITQNTQNAIINWNSFNVSSEQTVQFVGGNATLNRIADANPSQIDGIVTGDHALFFVNPNGIINNGTMSAPTIVLSTSDITDTNFNAGTYKFTRGTAAATSSITNSGTIGDGGSTGNIGVAALFATNVTNNGTISAHNVAIVAADQVTLGATTTGTIDGNSYDVTQNGYTGVTINTVSTVATSIQNNTLSSMISATDNNTLSSGNIDIYSTNGSIDNSGTNGTNSGISGIFSLSTGDNGGSSGNVTLNASGNIYNGGVMGGGTIYSEADNHARAGNVSVTSTAGTIDNSSSGNIDSVSKFYGSGGNVIVAGYNDVINSGGLIYSYGSTTAGIVSVSSIHGGVDNSNSGNINSSAYSGSSGNVLVTASGDIINGNITSNGSGSISSYSNQASSGDVTITSHTGYIDNSDGGYIDSSSLLSFSGNIVVSAFGNITNSSGIMGGGIYSEAYNPARAGNVSVTSTAGTINNSNASGLNNSIYSQSSGGTSGDVTVTAYGDINNAHSSIYSEADGSDLSGIVNVTSTNGAINNSNGQIQSVSASGISGNVAVSAYNNITNEVGTIVSGLFMSGGGNNTGTVTVTSTNGAIDNAGGSIYSRSTSGSSGDVTVTAHGDITNQYGDIYSFATGNNGSTGNVNVTSIAGAIDNSNTSPYVFQSGIYSLGSSVTVDAYNNVINSNGMIYSFGLARGVTVTSEHGAINNSSGSIFGEGVLETVMLSANNDITNEQGHISSFDLSGGGAGAVTVSSITGKVDTSHNGYIYSNSLGDVGITAHTIIDLTNGGFVGSVQSSGVTSSGTVTLTSPSLLYTTYAASTNSVAPSIVQSQSSTDGTTVSSNGSINIVASTINGANASTLSLSDFENTTNYFASSNPTTLPYVWYGVASLNGKTLVDGSTSSIVSQQQNNAINSIYTIVSNWLENTNVAFSSNPVVMNSNMQTTQISTTPTQSSFTSPTSSSNITGDSDKAKNNENMTTSAAPMEGQSKFTVGHDITGSGNATAFSTSIPGVFVLSDNE